MMDVSRGEPYLDQALASLATQTFADFEIVLCAHGATAGTEAIIANWEAREPRLRLIRSPRLPLARAHNLVARAARGPLLARLDADDVARPERLARQVARFAADPELGFLGSSVDLIDEAGSPLSHVRNPLEHGEIAGAIRNSCPMVHSTMMVRAVLFHAAGGYRDGLNISEDYDLYCRMIELGRAANIATPLVEYRIHSQSITSRRSLRMAIANEAVRAGIEARRRGLPEPFVRGIPCLRLTAELMGVSHSGVRRKVLATASQSRTSRLVLTGRIPMQLNAWARDLALRLGLRPVYSAAFRLLVEVMELVRAGLRK